MLNQARRDSWLEAKTKEIKDVTIKGLEPEIQGLVTRHRKETTELRDHLQDDAKRQLDALCGQHDDFVRLAQPVLAVHPCLS
jgi:hypothetical protein